MDELYFCSGYFNPPSALCSIMADSKCKIDLLSADREANGFNNAGWPKSGVTPAYQMFADSMIKEIGNKEMKLAEWNRPNWTFHGKGMWFYQNGNCIGTAIGSSNFSYRSYQKDLEAGGIIFIQNIKLQKKFDLERKNIWKYSTPRTIHPIPTWVRKVAPRIRAYF